MMQTHNFILPFKGNRTYIQGPDIFNEMVKYFINNKVTDCHFTIHKMSMNNEGTVYFTTSLEEFKTITQPPHATGSLNVDGKKYWAAVLFKDEQLENTVRVPYDEQLLIEKCHLSEESILLRERSPYTFIETIVSMQKKLLHTLYPHKNKWLFTKLFLTESITDYKNITISFRKNFNFKLVKSDIFINDALVGEVYFSLAE